MRESRYRFEFYNRIEKVGRDSFGILKGEFNLENGEAIFLGSAVDDIMERFSPDTPAFNEVRDLARRLGDETDANSQDALRQTVEAKLLSICASVNEMQLRRILEELAHWDRELATNPDSLQAKKMRSVYSDASVHYRQWFREHGIEIPSLDRERVPPQIVAPPSRDRRGATERELPTIAKDRHLLVSSYVRACEEYGEPALKTLYEMTRIPVSTISRMLRDPHVLVALAEAVEKKVSYAKKQAKKEFWSNIFVRVGQLSESARPKGKAVQYNDDLANPEDDE